MPTVDKPVVVGITGASGAVLARRTVDELLRREVPTICVCSNGGKLVWQDELGESFNTALAEWVEHPSFTWYPVSDLRAPIASGTFATAGMAVVPCSMNSLASLAHGISNNLLLRAADVCLKEKRPLVLVPRETPVHSIHLENMLALSRMGVTILPPAPAFYLQPASVDDMVRYFVEKILVSLGVNDELSDDLRYDERSQD